MKIWLVIVVCVTALASCKKEDEVKCEPAVDDPFNLVLPSHFPPIEFPEDNELTEKRVELGRRLFYDTRLSADNSISCGSCHHQASAFTDNLSISEGIESRIGFRNSPTLGNVAYQERLFGEGGVPNLEIQILAPIGDENEFDHDVEIIEAELQADPILNNLSLIAYDRDIDIYTITRAIACFERTMITGGSPYDEYVLGEESLTEDALAGMELFFSEELACGTCHSGHNFTDGGFHNIGLYEIYEDAGRFRITNDEEDKGKFKTPSLRNIEKTYPYMHNGSIQTLEEVIDHFSTGGLGHINQSELVVPLELTGLEKSQLLAFLTSLTDLEFLMNSELTPLN